MFGSARWTATHGDSFFNLDPSDSYESEPVGDADDPRVTLLAGRGRLVHAIDVQHSGRRVVGMAWELAAIAAEAPAARTRIKQSPEEVEAAHGAGAESAERGNWRTRFVGRPTDVLRRQWSVSWSADSLLGLEVGLTNRQGKEVICGIRALARHQWAFEDWMHWQGVPGVRQVLVLAKPGFAVGAVRIYGKSSLDGLQLTFCGIRNGRLDIQDGYNSAPVGTVDERNFVQLTGRGRTIVGLFGDNGDGDLEGFGLQFAKENMSGK